MPSKIPASSLATGTVVAVNISSWLSPQRVEIPPPKALEASEDRSESAPSSIGHHRDRA